MSRLVREAVGYTAASGCALIVDLGVGLALNAAVIYVAFSVFAIYFLAAKCIAAGFTFVFNFFARRQLLFVPGSPIRNRTSHVAP